MNNIPIFDTLTHPTIDGNWLLPKYFGKSDFDNLIQSMRSNTIKWAFAVGMKGIGSYHEDLFIDLVSKYNELLPIAYFDLENCNYRDIRNELVKIKSKGFVGIKLHPRISNFGYNDLKLPDVILIANELKLVVLFCTYQFDNSSFNGTRTIELLMDLVYKLNGAKIVLLHSGGVKLIEYMELARAYPNVLLDLSLTICKYDGSSIDMDIRHMFNLFDRRICIGTDHPEFCHNILRKRFEYFGKGLNINKLENIAYKNIIEFCDLHYLL